MCSGPVAQWSVSVYVEEVWCTAQAVQGQCGREDQKGLDSAWAGNRTRASRVAGENSTTEPPMPLSCWCLFIKLLEVAVMGVPGSDDSILNYK